MESQRESLAICATEPPFASLSMGFHKPAPTAALSLHDSRITSISAIIDDPIPADIFDFWLDTLIALRGPDILRMKGIVHVEGRLPASRS